MMNRLLLVLLLFAPAGPAAAQGRGPADARIARDTFDPAVHAVGKRRGGSIDLLVGAGVLVRSLQVRLPDLADVGSIEKQTIADADFLVFSGWVRGAAYRRYLVAVRLRYDPEGFAFADRLVKVCVAREEAVCSDCVLTAAGCRCWADDQAFCGSTAGDEVLFSKIPIAEH